MELEQAIKIVKAAGYRVSKPKIKVLFNGGLNAIGKPYGANYDPNYKVKMSLTSIARLLKPMPDDTCWME